MNTRKVDYPSMIRCFVSSWCVLIVHMIVCPYCCPLFYGRPPLCAQSQTQYDEVLASATILLRRVKVRSLWDCLRPPHPHPPKRRCLPSVGDAHHLCSPHHCSDGLCRDNNSPFNLLNDHNREETTALVCSVSDHICIAVVCIHM